MIINISPSLTPLKRGFLRLFIGRKTYQEVSKKKWTLCPSESYTTHPAFYLDNSLDRVTGVHLETTFKHEMERIQGGIREHEATVAYQLQDVEILNGFVYKGAMKYPLVGTKEAWWTPPVTKVIPEAALACSYSGNRYFGHWLRDDLPLVLAAQKLSTPVTVSQPLTKHKEEYSNLLNLYPVPINRVKCNNLIIIRDIGQNKDKRERYQTIRDQLKSRYPPSSKKGAMILRKSSGVKRLLVNETDIAAFLENKGFAILDPETMSVEEMLRQSLGVKTVIGVEGSHLMHGLFAMASDGVEITLQPPDRFNNVHKDFTDCLGMQYGFLVGYQEDEGFKIDLGELEQILDKI